MTQMKTLAALRAIAKAPSKGHIGCFVTAIGN